MCAVIGFVKNVTLRREENGNLTYCIVTKDSEVRLIYKCVDALCMTVTK